MPMFVLLKFIKGDVDDFNFLSILIVLDTLLPKVNLTFNSLYIEFWVLSQLYKQVSEYFYSGWAY